MHNPNYGEDMFQTQPVIATMIVIYTAFTSTLITKAVIESKPVEVPVVEQVFELTTMPETEVIVIATTTTLPMPIVSEKTKNKIPQDNTQRCPDWESEFVKHGLPPKLFSYIAWRESRCNPQAHNTTLNKDGSQDLGLLQINSTWKTVTKNICGASINELFDPTCNLKVAKYLYDNGGPGHWSM